MARNAGCLNMKVVEIILLLFLMACSLSVFLCRNLLVAAILFMANSLIMSIIWVILQSPDLAVTEAAVGAGVTGILLFITLYKVNGLRGKTVSEDIGKRGLRVFVDWVENGQDWMMRKVPMERQKVRMLRGRPKRKVLNGIWAGGLRNSRRSMPCVYSAVSTGLLHRQSVWRAWRFFS